MSLRSNWLSEILLPFLILGIGVFIYDRLGEINAKSGDTRINVERIATAIKVEEGSRHPYGIISVRCTGEDDCRHVCIKTIRHRLKDFEKSHQTGVENFINALAQKYDAGDERAGQKRWAVNVSLLYFERK